MARKDRKTGMPKPPHVPTVKSAAKKATRKEERKVKEKAAKLNKSTIAKKMRGPRPPRNAMSSPMGGVAAATMMPPHEYFSPESDMRTLEDAAKIKSNKTRHRAAVEHGRQRIEHMKRAVKVSTRDV